MPGTKFHALYSDIGSVLGTNGWDSNLRRKIAAHFQLKFDDIESRHRLMFDTYERGFMTFEEYLRRVFFASPRSFTVQDLREHAFHESVPWPENIELFHQVKKLNGLKLALISNEGSGLTEYRLRKFGLRTVADFMVVSSFVHLRKPDRAIWQLALDLAQSTPEESIYVDDREIFVEVAADMGFTTIHHVSLENTRKSFEQLGLLVD
jgi:putative hydrolase of the HAD superfamily